MNDAKDYYAILELSPGVPMAEVKARFRHLAMAVHPDRNENDAGCQERLRRINAAYEFLSDSSRKADYDARHGRQPVSGTATAPQPSAPNPPLRYATSDGGMHRLLALVVFCVLLGGCVAVLAFVASSQSSSNSDLAPVVTVIALPPDAGDSPLDGVQAASVPAPNDGAAARDYGPPVSEKSLWPAAPLEPPAAPTDANAVPPASGAAPAATGAWPPPPDTGAFPSH